MLSHIQFYCLRHGTSTAISEGKIASSPAICIENYGLTPGGQEEAKQTARTFIQQNPTIFSQYTKDTFHILTSDFRRASETAQIFGDELSRLFQEHAKANPSSTQDFGFSLESEPLLRERWFGDLDGTSTDNYKIIWEQDNKDESIGASGSESCVEVRARMLKLLHRIVSSLDQTKQHLVIFTSHGDSLQILSTIFQKIPPGQHRTLKHLNVAELRFLGTENDIPT
ncbi:putative histidine phosphatase family protein [Blattamonas nauphoetae]|uniref:Histidine phosphatase family protein n=1 Tax=Blattamonas nauphoetae TaxID=2049346 RepID=A0ABQ9Y9M3_9EUKA|nr:putative histidine phosphatase family protein [Blattamonas nauphoetae]